MVLCWWEWERLGVLIVWTKQQPWKRPNDQAPMTKERPSCQTPSSKLG